MVRHAACLPLSLALCLVGAATQSSLVGWGARPAAAAAPGPSRQAGMAWRTYRDTVSGYSVRYPATWKVHDYLANVPRSTIFTPPGGGAGITITVVANAADGPAQSDLPNGHCQLLRHHGMTGIRCFATLSFTTYTTFVGADWAYTISGGRRTDFAVYDRMVKSFRTIVRGH